MTTITGTTERPRLRVAAFLTAASDELEAGGQAVTQSVTRSDDDGAWSLTDLTPLPLLSVPDGAYYTVAIGGARYTIEVPASGTHELGDVLIEPGGLPDTVPRTAVYVYDEDTAAYVLEPGARIFIGGPTDPTTETGDIWLDVDA